MQPFEFVMILVSIILGLGITDLLGTLGRILRGEARAGLLHSLWSAFVLIALVQQFWSKWYLSGRADWSLADLSLFLLPALLLYVAASVLSPTSAGEPDLDAFLMERRLQFFLVLAILNVAYAIESWFLTELRPGFADVMRAAVIAIYLVLASARSRRVQLLGCGVAYAIVLYFAFLFTGSLGGMADS